MPPVLLRASESDSNLLVGGLTLVNLLDDVFVDRERDDLRDTMMNMSFEQALDSDEEAQLHMELDTLVEMQEKMETLDMDMHK